MTESPNDWAETPPGALLTIRAGGCDHDGLRLDGHYSDTQVAVLRHVLDAASADPNIVFAVHIAEGEAWVDERDVVDGEVKTRRVHVDLT